MRDIGKSTWLAVVNDYYTLSLSVCTTHIHTHYLSVCMCITHTLSICVCVYYLSVCCVCAVPLSLCVCMYCLSLCVCCLSLTLSVSVLVLSVCAVPLSLCAVPLCPVRVRGLLCKPPRIVSCRVYFIVCYTLCPIVPH